MHGDAKDARSDRIRVALVHPTYWPEVKRGSERFIHDLAADLSRRGHEVSVLTGHRGRRSRVVEDGFEVIRGWRPPTRLRPAGFEPYTEHAPLALFAAARRRFDLVHALHTPDAWAVSWWTRATGRPLVFSLMGYPDRRSLDAYRGRRRMLSTATRRAGGVHVLSDAAAEALREGTGIDATVINPGTDTSAFAVDVPRTRAPTVFCAASPRDARKRVPLLVEAFGRVRTRRPDARLLIDTGESSAEHEDLRSDGVELIDARAGGLATHYASSWVTVLPSEREAFGLVLVESLAAGTPAVGIRDGGVTEILGDPGVGVLAGRADPGALADAIESGLALSQKNGVGARCRAYAERWDWRNVGPKFETLYREAIDAAR